LGAKEGDPLLASKADAEARLEKVDGVVLTRLEAVCCEAGGAILFVGIEEKGSPHFDYRAPPESSAALPEEIVDAYRRFLEAYEASARSAEPREDLTRGHALSANADVRALQQGFVELAEANFAKLREVLRESADGEQRGAAAYVMGYAPDKRAVAGELQYALQDPDEGVRRNAMRGLAALAVLAARSPDSQIRIAPTWLIEMLNSILWGDRTHAAALLATLTESRDPGVLAQMRERALPSLLEMARWNSLAYALPAYVLAGRIAGLTEKEIQDTWSKGEREAVLSRAAAPAKPGK
jgi:HEAT repeat protein